MFVSAFNKRGGFPFDPSNPHGFNHETLHAMDDAVTGRNVSGPFNTVDELAKELNKDWFMFTIKFTSTFKKDYKLIKQQGKYAQDNKSASCNMRR